MSTSPRELAVVVGATGAFGQAIVARLVRAVDARLQPGARLVAGVANAALFNVMRQLSLAYGPRGITAHTLAPGPADTERLHRVAADRARLQDTTPEAVLDAGRRRGLP